MAFRMENTWPSRRWQAQPCLNGSIPRWLATLAIMLLVTACTAPAPGGGSTSASPSATAPPAPAREHIAVAYSAISAAHLPMWVAQEQGFFDQNGLSVEIISIAGGSSPTAALLSGQIQFLQISVEAMQATLNGADLVYIAAPSEVASFSLFAVPAIRSGAELKGKRIGVTGVGTATYTAARLALKSFGLTLDDVQITSVNSVPAILAAMLSGAVDAGAISVPTTLLARKAGLTELVNVAELHIPFPNAWQTASRAYLQSHPDVARRFTRSIVQAIGFMKKDPAGTQHVLGKYANITDPAVLDESYQSIAKYLLADPTPSTAAVKNALEELSATLPQAASADPNQFVDLTYINELKQSGFVSQQLGP
jgi:ABC-type nitrate/sulfonate/bicarbonate transport system substrate-binding protein